MKRMLAAGGFLCLFAVCSGVFAAETAGWSNRNLERRELIARTPMLWQEQFAGTMDDFTVEYCNGAKGSVAIENGELKIVKTNSDGCIIVKSKRPLTAKKNQELQTSVYVRAADARPDYVTASVRLAGKDGSLAYFKGLDGRGGGGPKMNYLTNTPNGVRERKLAHLKISAKSGNVITPAIVVGGVPSTSFWSDWSVEDYQKVKALWRQTFEAPKALPEFFVLTEAQLQQKLAAEPDHTAKVVTVNGVSTLLVDGKAAEPVIFKHVKSDYSGRSMEKDGKINLRSVMVRLGVNPKYQDGMWLAKGVFDPANGLKKVQQTLRSFPDARIILSIRVEAYADFCQDYPDEVWRRRDGKIVHGHHVHAPFHLKDPIPAGHWAWPSYSSRVWRDQAKKYITEFIEALKSSGMSKQIVGVHICGYHDGQMSTRHADFGLAAQRGFREYLRKKYGTVKKLSAAWKRKVTSFDSVMPPEFTGELFIAPAEQDKLDYYTFIKHEPFRAVEEFAQTAKAAFGKDIIAVRWSQGAHGGTMVSAYDVVPFLRSKYVDALVAQPSYSRRTPGLATRPRLPLTSFHNAGKLFIHEFDLRTWPRISPGETELRVIGLSNAVDKEMWSALHRKMSGQMIANRMGYWYLDMGGGWYEHPDIVADAAAAKAMMKQLNTTEANNFYPAAAFVIDDENCMRRNFIGKYYSSAVDHELDVQMTILSSSGVPFDVVFLSDLLKSPALARTYSTLIFAQMYQIDAKRQKLLNFLGDYGKNIIMLSGGGVLGGLDKTFGLKLKTVKKKPVHIIRSAPGEKLQHLSGMHIAALANDARSQAGGVVRYSIVPGKNQTVRAVFTADNAPAIVEKTFRQGKVIYIAAYSALSAGYFHQIVASNGGYTAVDRGGMQVDMNGNFISAHCVIPGKYTFNLPFDAEVVNLKNNQLMAVSEEKFTINAEAGTTYWFEIRRKHMERKLPRRRDLIPVNYDESRVPQYTLPSPLTGKDGKKITTVEAWEKRRQEILDFYKKEYYGQNLPVPDKFEVEVVSVKNDAMDNTAIRKELRLSFAMNNGRKHSFIMLLYIPKNRAPMPVFCGLNFKGNHTVTGEEDITVTGYDLNGNPVDPVRGCRINRWQVAEAMKRGYAIATACYHDIFPDFRNAAGSWEKSVYAMFFPGRRISEIHENHAAIGAWSWALKRMLDVLEKEPLVDASRAAVVGHSRLGKTALWTGANDERFSIVITNGSGHGGAALIRRYFGETNEILARSFPHWFVPDFRKYLTEKAVLPHDQHFLLSLMAPRTLCIGSATQDLWADPKGEFLAGVHAGEVYALYGKKGLPVSELPAPDTPVFGDGVNYQIRTGKHDLTAGDWQLYFGAADRLWE